MVIREASGGAVIGPAIRAEAVREYAAKNAVCVRPLLRQVTDRETGTVEQLVIPCGSTREHVCEPCADKARRLRAQQCAEGWHLADDPLEEATGSPDESADDCADDDADNDAADEGSSPAGGRRVRSTRRRCDVEDLPRVPVEQRSVGRTFRPRTGGRTGRRCSSPSPWVLTAG